MSVLRQVRAEALAALNAARARRPGDGTVEGRKLPGAVDSPSEPKEPAAKAVNAILPGGREAVLHVGEGSEIHTIEAAAPVKKKRTPGQKPGRGRIGRGVVVKRAIGMPPLMWAKIDARAEAEKITVTEWVRRNASRGLRRRLRKKPERYRDWEEER